MRPSMCMALLALSACGGQSARQEVQREVHGDTTVLLSTGAPDTLVLSNVRILWQSDELGRPGPMALAGDRLVIGDGTRLHIVPVSGGAAVSVGQEGGGPGDFASINLVGALGDTLIVFDRRNSRIAYYSSAGEFLHTARLTMPRQFMNPVSAGPLTAWRGGFLLEGMGLGVFTNGAPAMGILWLDAAVDTATVIEEHTSEQLVDLGGIYTTRQMFPPWPIFAIGPGPRIAMGDGLDYCVTVRSLADHGIRRLCRDRPRAAVGSGIRHPDLSVIKDEQRRQHYQAMLEHQEIGSELPSYDVLRFAEDGSLWVRTVGADLANLAPQVRSLLPGPKEREWDVFDPEGRLLHTVRLPSTFDPRVMTNTEIYGFYELDSGEIVIGVMDAPAGTL